MTTGVVFWGATGHAKVLRPIVEDGGLTVMAVFDNNPAVPAPFPDVPLFYGAEGFSRWLQASFVPGTRALVAIGGARGSDRVEIQRTLVSRGLMPTTAIHRTAHVEANAIVGPGSQILAHATVCVEARLGEACIVNTGASVDHECEIGDGVHIAPGAVLAGSVRVGERTMIGAGAVVLPRITIGRNVVIGAGSVVTRDIPDDVVAFGSPAKVIRRIDAA